MNKQPLTKEQAYQKLKHYCAYQDRCHIEVKQKAYSLGMKKPEAEELISMLIEEGCLNEERFARLFAGGKFRMKQWGREKIKTELRKKFISNYCIAAALNELDEKNYRETLHQLAVNKWKTIKGAGTNHFIKMSKTRNYLLSKGYEPGLVALEINELMKEGKLSKGGY